MDIRIDHLFEHSHHIQTVATWQHREFGYLTPQSTAEQRAERLNRAIDKSRLPIALVAIKDGALVGSAGISITTLTHQHLTPWLSAVVVPPAQRGNGIASKLALAAVDEVGRLGFETIHLFTPKNESLYARLGWKTVDHAEINGVPVCVMARATR